MNVFSQVLGRKSLCKYLQIGLASVVMSGAAHAQAPTEKLDIPALLPAKSQNIQRRVQVRNVPILMMAWWLDPAHQPVPIQVQFARQSAPLLGEFGALPAPVSPLSAEQLKAVQMEVVDEQNALLLSGDKAAIKAFEEAVKSLDRPLRQIEVEANFVRGDAEIVASLLGKTSLPFVVAALPAPKESYPAKQIALMAEAEKPQARLELRAAASGWAQQLAALAGKRAHKLSSPRLTAINHLPASLISTMHQPMKLAAVANEEFGIEPLWLQNRFGVAVKADVATDELITLTVRAGRDTSLHFRNDALSLNVPPIVKFDIADGQTVALILPDSAMPREEIAKPAGAPQMNLCLITPRLIRRLDDTQPVPGT